MEFEFRTLTNQINLLSCAKTFSDPRRKDPIDAVDPQTWALNPQPYFSGPKYYLYYFGGPLL